MVKLRRTRCAQSRRYARLAEPYREPFEPRGRRAAPAPAAGTRPGQSGRSRRGRPGTARTEPAAIALTTPAVPGSSALSPGAAVSVLGAYAVLLLAVAAQLVLHRDAA